MTLPCRVQSVHKPYKIWPLSTNQTTPFRSKLLFGTSHLILFTKVMSSKGRHTPCKSNRLLPEKQIGWGPNQVNNREEEALKLRQLG